MAARPRRRRFWIVLAASLMAVTAREADAQLGALVSPGRLSRPHAALEGIGSCLQCHSAGRQVSAEKCLTCHQPVAQRIAQKRGVHKAVGTDCVSCHVEHAGVNGELRPFDQRRFDHKAQTGFALDGLHAPPDVTCESCHKPRSFLTVTSSCTSCHADTHKGTLGAACANCHSTAMRFADTRTRFDHSKTAFALSGAHAAVACASCHKTTDYRRVEFKSCTSCHTDPHRPRLGATCESCHTTKAWQTTKIDHSITSFPLRGLHATVTCVACHAKPAVRVTLKADTCASCHSDPHRGTFKQDCASCHTEAGFPKGTFDHSTTRFVLTDGHGGLACVACHTSAQPMAPVRSGAAPPAARPAPAARSAAARTTAAVDFRGLTTDCVACHTDVHRGELGAACESCHSARTFKVANFRHARQRPFFDGQHAPLQCAQCHQTPHLGLANTSDTCASCHKDVHLGQVTTRCETCHTVEGPKFAVKTFAHEKTIFPLTGKHAPLACEACHKVETRQFPTGHGTARRLTGISTECASCHMDPHGGQFRDGCQSCHTMNTFAVTNYSHQRASALRSFFTGRHVIPCASCHKPSSARTAAAQPAVVAYQVSTTCTTCHTDVHRGALGARCESCHRP